MTTPNFFLLSILCVLITQSCTDESALTNENTSDTNDTATKSYAKVDQRLWPYFEAFEIAALERGYIYDLNDLGITGVIRRINDNGVAGTCQYGTHIHHVTIDSDYWEIASKLNREYVVFHELGHCALGRGHKEDANQSGYCLSLMNSGTTDCRVLYNNNNLDYYQDELFKWQE